mgnify:CR=1 FL=1
MENWIADINEYRRYEKMSVTKEQLNLQAQHLNELLKKINRNVVLTIDYSNGLPELHSNKLVANRHIDNDSIITLPKKELETAMLAIKWILNEIRQSKRTR